MSAASSSSCTEPMRGNRSAAGCASNSPYLTGSLTFGVRGVLAGVALPLAGVAALSLAGGLLSVRGRGIVTLPPAGALPSVLLPATLVSAGSVAGVEPFVTSVMYPPRRSFLRLFTELRATLYQNLAEKCGPILEQNGFRVTSEPGTHRLDA